MNVKTFKRGVHPDYHKELTSARATERAALPKTVIIPLQQHIGDACSPLVKKGEQVEEGQKIGDIKAFVSTPVHSSISGKVKDIDLLPHPVGGKVLSVAIQGDGAVRNWDEGGGEVGLDLDSLTVEKLREVVKEAGIAGMGGAAFPTYVKLSPPKKTRIHTVILNGCECEPYLTADQRLMVEEPEKVMWGLKAIMKTLNAQKGYIGIEENKPDAIEALTRVLDIVPGTEIIPLETKYPQGAEKMLIMAILGKKVPVGKLPLDIGVVVNNTGTAFAIYEAIKYGKPLIERIVTISGNGVKEPRNLWVRIGTSFSDVLGQCGGIVEQGEKVVLNGGPMMGIAQMHLNVPVVKGTSGITVLTADTVKPVEFGPCIRCSTCVDVCPMGLMPYRLGDMGRLYITEGFGLWGGLSCIECGCCSFVCPSKRPLLQWIRVGKLKYREEAKGSAA